MAASALARRHAQSIELLIEGQTEVEQMETLLDALTSQLRVQIATLAVAKQLTRRHRNTLHEATGAAEAS